jgi:catechol 2,3-dioxygenase-like lactoylglutathione lyase family enzyme
MPAVSGIHHLKIPVGDLGAAAEWYRRVFGARREERFDHRDEEGALFAVIMTIPGLGTPVELRLAPRAAAAVAGYDPITFAVAGRPELDDWVRHLDECGVEHSAVVQGFAGHLISFTGPGGLVLRLYTEPAGGFDAVGFDPAGARHDAPGMRSDLMSPR